MKRKHKYINIRCPCCGELIKIDIDTGEIVQAPMEPVDTAHAEYQPTVPYVSSNIELGVVMNHDRK